MGILLGMLPLIAVAGVVGLVCHWTTRRLCGPGGYGRLVVASMLSAAVTAWVFLLIDYIKRGEWSDIAGPPVFIAVLSFMVSLFAGVPFLMRRSAGHPG